MMKSIRYLLITCAFLACKTGGNQEHSWKLIYKNDKNGKAMYGNKKDLINAVRNGCPLRIGFGARFGIDSTLSIEHIADAGFLTILNNEDVYAQISQIIGQDPLIEKDTTNITFRQRTRWSIVLGTNGFSDRLTASFNNDTILGNNHRNMNVSWFSKKIDLRENQPIPLWKKK